MVVLSNGASVPMNWKPQIKQVVLEYESAPAKVSY